MNKARRAAIEAIVNKHDPIGLLAIGAPQDEYRPEIDSIQVSLFQDPDLSADECERLLCNIFAKWFSESMVRANPTPYNYKLMAADLLAMQINVPETHSTDFNGGKGKLDK